MLWLNLAVLGGARFIEALEEFTDSARLGRGRSYASGGKILEYKI